MNQVHNLNIQIDWELISIISKIDRFDAKWSSIEKKEGQSLKHLKAIATVRSVGASTRIEGSKMNDEEVDAFLNDINVDKLIDRDKQEVAGYFEVLDLISENYDGLAISENSIKNLHHKLLKYSTKDGWHKGNYKQLSNNVEATFANGAKQIVFKTAAPGIETEDAMRGLIEWFRKDKETHSLVKSALFCYDFVSIHPFQDGNGRMSRLLSSLLLQKFGYNWIQYVSFEHEIENRKSEYYRELRKCQAQRPNEEVTSWVFFFLDALLNIQNQLMSKLNTQGLESNLSPKEKSIYVFITDHPGTKSGEIASKLNIPNSTVKKLLAELVSKNLIEKFGVGRGVNYSLK
ncbi:MAG: Fic family protein [Pelobium sp.]